MVVRFVNHVIGKHLLGDGKPKKHMSFGRVRRDPADILFSKYIRRKANWTCERCLRYLGEGGGEASHFHGRRKESVRYDEINVSCLCNSCHRHLGEHPLEHVEWKQKQLGQAAFDRLTVRAEMRCKKDRRGQAMYWKERLKEFA